MKRSIVAIALLVLTASTQARSTPPPPLEGTLEPGIALIGWENSVRSDTVIVVLERHDCRSPVFERVENPSDPQAMIQIPSGPPFDERCLLKPGDHVYLLRYRDGRYIDEIGPYVVPVHVYLPTIR